MTDCFDFIIFWVIWFPLYAPLAGLSFDYHVVKFQASDQSILGFINSLYPPMSWIFFSKTRRISEIVASGSDGCMYLNYVQAKRNPPEGRFVALLINLVPTIIAFRGIQAAQNNLRVIALVSLIFVSLITVLMSFRFGHKLGQIHLNDTI